MNWWDGVGPIVAGLAAIVWNRRAARDCAAFRRGKKMTLFSGPWEPEDDEFERACRSYRIIYIALGLIFVGLGVWNLLRSSAA